MSETVVYGYGEPEGNRPISNYNDTSNPIKRFFFFFERYGYGWKSRPRRIVDIYIVSTPGSEMCSIVMQSLQITLCFPIYLYIPVVYIAELAYLNRNVYFGTSR